jgi:hypothetical protein
VSPSVMPTTLAENLFGSLTAAAGVAETVGIAAAVTAMGFGVIPPEPDRYFFEGKTRPWIPSSR